MMNRVVAVVENECVEDPIEDISGVVNVGFLVGMDVLEVIEDQHGVQCHLMREEAKQHGLLPVQSKGNGIKDHQDGVLGEVEPELLAALLPAVLQEHTDWPLLIIGTDGGVAQQCQQILLQYDHLRC